jgi:hypothetical protein
MDFMPDVLAFEDVDFDAECLRSGIRATFYGLFVRHGVVHHVLSEWAATNSDRVPTLTK